MVLQDTWLFEGTIAENIAYGKPDASREEIIAAAKAARADFFIRTLPKGYDTVLGSDAETISAGQRQLLTIARVMLCDPAILILDEATSSVDTRTEMEISLAMNTLMRGRTSFCDRPPSVYHCGCGSDPGNAEWYDYRAGESQTPPGIRRRLCGTV